MSSSFVKRVGIGAFLLWVVWALHPLLAKRLMIQWDATTVGQWGDAFGGLSSLFSVLAFVAVLFTLKQQREDLTRQQQQILNAEQNQHRQRFEDNFFQLLSVIRENRKDVRFRNSATFVSAGNRGSKEMKEGHPAFRAAYEEMRYWVGNETDTKGPLDRERLAELYADKVHTRYESTLGAYFRLVYETLDRVDRDPYLSDKEKNEFGNLVRGQMTSFEAAIAGCNALNDFAKDFNRLVNRFRLLKYAKTGIVYDELIKHYPPETFQGRDTNKAPVPDVIDDSSDDIDAPD